MPHFRPASALVRWVMLGAAMVVLAGAGVVVLRYLRPAVTITEVTRGPVVQAFYATGTLSAEREYPINTPVEGTVQPLDGDAFIDKGSRVTKGQPVAKVLDPALVYTFDKTLAALDEAKARADEQTSPVVAEFDAKITASQELLDIARAEQRRVTKTLESGAAAPADLDRALERVKNYWSDLESAKAQRASLLLRLKMELASAASAHKIAQWNLDQQTLPSPIDGVVLDRPASPGTRLAINDHVMQIADVSPENLVMRAAVDEENMTEVRIGQKVVMTLYAFGPRAFIGTVSRIYDKADPDRRTFEIDVKPAEPSGQFAAGMTGELAFIVEERADVPVVPAQSLQGGRLFTLRDGRLTAVEPKIGLKSIERVEVQSGLEPGDVVVISPVATLREGQPVRVGKRMDPRDAAGLNKPKEKDIFRGGF